MKKKNNIFEQHNKKLSLIKDEEAQLAYQKEFMLSLSDEDLLEYINKTKDDFFESVKTLLDNPATTKSEISVVKSGLDEIQAQASLMQSKGMKAAKAA
jgi:hypothetical protein